jgi:hypothetical protein
MMLDPPPFTTTHFSKDPDYYPDLPEFMVALQDPGVTDKKSADGVIRYPKLLRLAGKVFDKMQKHAFPNLPTNRSRAAHALARCIVKCRRHADKSDTLPELRLYGAEGSSQVYILQNNADYFGFDVVLTHYANHLASSVVLKQADRTAGDAIRVGAVMLHRDNLKTVAGILAGNKDRAKADQAVDPTKAWAIEAVKLFRDINFVVSRPDGMDPADVDDIDPNDPERIALPRDAQWFLDTWRYYLKKKYKAAIAKWDTETGGGGKEPAEFANYCDTHSRWLVWVYLLDMENNYLLFSNAKGTPPVYVGLESGFENPSNGTATDDNVPSSISTRGSNKSASATAAKAELRKRGRDVSELLTGMRNELDKRMALGPPVTETMPGGTVIQSIMSAIELKEKLEKGCGIMSPATKRLLYGTVNKTILGLGAEFKSAMRKDRLAEGDTNTDSESSE